MPDAVQELDKGRDVRKADYSRVIERDRWRGFLVPAG